jgi:hypothetical protein
LTDVANQSVALYSHVFSVGVKFWNADELLRRCAD